MTEFNPTIKDLPERSYLGLSKPIETPDFKSGVGSLAKNIGELFTGVIKGVDDLNVIAATDDARKVAEPQQRGLITAFQTATLNPGGTVPAQESDGVLPPSLLNARAEAPLPEEIKKLPDKLAAYVGARDSGKYGETLFHGQMDRLAQQVRSRHGMAYRDVIDQEFAKYTGGDPANLYIKSVLRDINDSITNRRTEYNSARELVDYISKEGAPMPGVPGMKAGEYLFPLLQAAPNDPKVHSYIRAVVADVNGYKYRADKTAKEVEDVKGNRELLGFKAEDDFRSTANLKTTAVFTNLERIAETLGVPRDEYGNFKPSPEQAGELARQYRTYQQNLLNELNAHLRDPAFAGGKSRLELMREGKSDEIMNGVSGVFTTAISNLTDDKTGFTTYAARQAKVIQDQNEFLFLTGKGNINELIRRANTIDKLAPSLLKDVMISQFRGSLGPALNTYFNLELADMAEHGKSYAEVFDDAMKEKKPIPAAFYDKVIGTLDRLKPGSGADDKEREALVRSVANPKNAGLIEDKIRGWDGKMSTLGKMTSEETINEIGRVAKNDSSLINKYKDWVLPTVRNLFVTDFRTIGEQLQEIPQDGSFRWSVEDHRLHYDYKGIRDYSGQTPVYGAPSSRRDWMGATDVGPNVAAQTYAIQVNRLLSRTNDGVQALVRTSKIDPSINVDAFVLDNISRLGIDLNKVGGLPEAIQKAIVAAHTEPPKPPATPPRGRTNPAPISEQNRTGIGR